MSDIYSKKVKMEMVSDVIVSCILRIHNFFSMNAQPEMFKPNLKKFKPNVDCSSHCFKILNRHILLISLIDTLKIENRQIKNSRSGI